MSSKFKMKPVVKGNLQGLDQSQQALAEMIYSKPILSFEISAQASVGDKIVNATVEFHFQIDPTNQRPEHANYIQAVRDRLQAAQRFMEKVALASHDRGKVSGMVSKEELPDTRLLTELYAELDEASDERLVAMVMKDDMGETMWDFIDKNGVTPKLTVQFLRDNPRVGEAMQAAFQDWYIPTRASSEAAMSAKMVSTTTETTSETQNPSPAASPTHSIVPDAEATQSSAAATPS